MKQQRKKLINFKVTEDEYRRLIENADLYGYSSVSDYIRKKTIKDVKRKKRAICENEFSVTHICSKEPKSTS